MAWLYLLIWNVICLLIWYCVAVLKLAVCDTASDFFHHIEVIDFWTDFLGSKHMLRVAITVPKESFAMHPLKLILRLKLWSFIFSITAEDLHT